MDSHINGIKEVVAPHEAVNAVIYATGHTKESLIIHKVSFKK
jgi:hypothetical protein